MREIIERERNLTVTASCEVLVAGGGIAGIAAAIAAARGGKKVMLLEREFALGGMATLGLVTIYLPLCDGDGNQLIFGIGEELLKLSIKHGAEACYPKPWLEDGTREERIKMRYLTQFNPHLFALNTEKLLKELGVEIRYGTLAAQTVVENERITHVIVEDKSGRSAIAVESVVDCTGDADICHLAGAPTALHKGGNGLASWYYYQAAGVTKLKMFGLADLVIEENSSAKDSAPIDDKYNAEQTLRLDQNFRFSGVDGEELSRAVLIAHDKMLNDIMEYRSKDESYLPVTMSTIPLVRMSRRLVGEYEMDESEERKPMPDSIGMTGDWRKRGKAFEIPYSSLYCRQIKNLLVAGRNISVTDSMWDITRVIPGCAVTGEAAGTAAALGSDFSALDVTALHETLRRNGVKLHLSDIYS